MRALTALAVVAVLAGGSTGATASETKTAAAARAFSIQITVPGQTGAATSVVSAPPDASALAASFAYPADGSILSTGSIAATATTEVAGGNASARGTNDISSVQLFGGEVTVSTVSTRASSRATPRSASGSLAGSSVSGLVVLGQAVSAGPGQRIQLGDWGYAVALAETASPASSARSNGYRTSVTTLDVHVTVDHGGLPAGSRIVLGYAESSAQATVAPKRIHHRKRKHRVHHKKRSAHRTHHKRAHEPVPVAPEPSASPFAPAPVQQPPPKTRTARLTAGGYVFPVYGPVSFTDTFGSAREDTGWHHGDDIFAPLGAPVLSVAKGTVFSVGWNNVGGNRLWLKDRQGNEFYYAHLSAFSPLAVNGARVNAGDVLGFVGNTGDAAGTPYHLHFEIHPLSLLGMGYDGVIDPTKYLEAWQRLHDIAFPSQTAQDAGLASSRPSTAPEPGAILLHVSDISSAPSLDSASVQKALTSTYSVSP